MQTIKPMVLGLTTRPIEFRRRLGLSITTALYFPFKPAGEGTLWTEPSMWKFLEQEMPEGPFIDECIVKQRSEFLVRGSAYAPGGPGSKTLALEVSVSVAGVSKRLHVFGPRRWQGLSASEPEPFERVPLDWQHTYGGPDYPANPLGMGRVGHTGGSSKEPPRWLPQVVKPNHNPLGPDEAVPPTALGIIDCMWPQRAQHAGTYDERWLKEQSPGFASDIDWRYFNLAAEDQWFDTPPRGDERFEFINMHPSLPQLQGQLPGFVPRCFIDHGDGITPMLREVSLKLATLWFFPHAERGIALFQGLSECQEDDATDLKALIGAVERLGEAKPREHYLDALNKRRDPETGSLYAVRESDLLPTGFKSTDADFDETIADYQLEGLQAQAARRGAVFEVRGAIDKARAAGVDPAKLGLVIPEPEPTPSLEALPEYLAKKRAEMLNAQVSSALDAADRVKAARAQMVAAGIDPESLVHRGPPTYKAGAHLQQLTSQVPIGTPGVDLKALAPKLLKLESMQRIDYLQSAHAQPPAHPLPPARAKAVREAVMQGHAQGKSFLGVDLTGADLSGLDLSGADFSGAWLESVNFTNSVLKGTVFAHAVLAHANLTGADASQAEFGGANLGKANLKTTRLVQADLRGVTLVDTALAQTDLRGAKLHDAKLTGATFGLADWRSVQASGLFFHQAQLKDMVMNRCQLDAPTFVECDLSGVDFAAAELVRPTFVKCTGHGTRFARAVMEGAVFVDGCDFSSADFSEARLKGCNLRGATLHGARFAGADLQEADLSEADLTGADFSNASLRSALLIKTKLTQAVMSDCNLMNAIVQRADLRGADLRNANLYGSDLSRVWTDPGTMMLGAVLDRAKTYPRRENKSPA
ncbi:DUF2169 family type VI secretion system accessory protein [Aquabacterium sp.]|uniref:DUF2169 family type VI secretion system accessory protein n=1 Tax=Aquabacterium sp. TaxID=1872578 RepID=UPI002B6AA2B5|nr:DUF2169 domain-containing protein [Aquabacterium sp.]HSW08722.1 DUF2169 domain-containing protein [Aquabacterium sp.]